MKKIKRLSSISVVDGATIKEYVLPITPKTKFIVDDSHFCPMSEAIKQLSKAGSITSQDIKQNYDFPDGRDDGRSVPFSRSRPADITEISTHIMSEIKQTSMAIDSVNKEMRRRNKAIKDSMSAQSAPSAQSAQSASSGQSAPSAPSK